MNKTILVSLIAGLVNHAFEVAAADAPASVNPANIMNSINQTLPSSEAPPIQKNLEEPSSSQKIDQSRKSTTEILIKEVKLSGARHPVPAKVTAIYQRLIGQKVNFNDIQKTVADMQQEYRNEGLILVRVILPPQEISQEKGLIEIAIVEGQIEKVVFQDDLPQAVTPQMQRYAKQVEEEDPITYASIDRFLILANTLPGIQAVATLGPDQKVVGGSDLLIDVKQTKTSGFVNFNNRGTQYIGPNQLSLGASFYDIYTADSLSIVGATIPNSPSQLGYGNIRYGIVTGPYGTNVNASYTTTRSEPGNSLTAFNMVGKSEQYMLSINQPLLISTPQKFTFLSALTHLTSENNVFTNQQLYEDSITTLSVGLDYQRAIGQAINDIKFSVTKGLPILGAPSSLSNPSVAGAITNFVRFNVEGSSNFYLSRKTSMALGAQFQWSQNTLVSSEKISYGGPLFGQAYNPTVISGDSGMLGSLALRYDLPTADWMHLNFLQSEIFYDFGSVHLNNAAAGVRSNASGESAGIGLNLILNNHCKIGLALAKPLKLREAVDVDMGWRGFFNITGVF